MCSFIITFQEYNELFFGQNPKNQFESRNSKTEVVERTNQRDCNFNKEDDSDVIMNKEEEEEEEGMSWPEVFAKQLLDINGGEEFIKEKDVELMLDNSIHKDIFLGNNINSSSNYFYFSLCGIERCFLSKVTVYLNTQLR